MYDSQNEGEWEWDDDEYDTQGGHACPAKAVPVFETNPSRPNSESASSDDEGKQGSDEEYMPHASEYIRAERLEYIFNTKREVWKIIQNIMDTLKTLLLTFLLCL